MQEKVSAGDQYYNYIYSVGEIAKASEIFNRPYGYVAKVNDIVEFEGEWPASSDEDIANDGDTEAMGQRKANQRKRKEERKKKENQMKPPPAKKRRPLLCNNTCTRLGGSPKIRRNRGIRRR